MELEYYLCFHGDWNLIKDKTQVSAGHFNLLLHSQFEAWRAFWLFFLEISFL